MFRATILLCIWLSMCASVVAEDFQPKVCASAVEYVGGALHPAIAHEAFIGLDQPLVGDIDGPLAGKLADAVEWILKNTPAPGITAAVGFPGQGLWSTSRGLA